MPLTSFTFVHSSCRYREGVSKSRPTTNICIESSILHTRGALFFFGSTLLVARNFL